MAVLDFPSSPSIGQIATLTNGISYQWDGAVWTTPTNVGQAAGGDLSGTYPNPVVEKASGNFTLPTLGTAIAMGTYTSKSRLRAHPTQDASTEITTNMNVDVAAVRTQDDPTKPSWMMRLTTSADEFDVYRSPPGSVTLAQLLSVDNVGNLNLGGTIIRGSSASTSKSGLVLTPNYANLNFNYSTLGGDTTKVGWGAYCDSNADQFFIDRKPTGAGAAARMLTVDNVGTVYALRFWNGLAKFGWMSSPVQTFLASTGRQECTFTGVVTDYGGVCLPTYRQMMFDTNSVVLLGASMIIGANSMSLNIEQWDAGAGAWRVRVTHTSPNYGIATGHFVFCMAHTSWGQQFRVTVDNNAAANYANIVADSGPWFWGIQLGRGS